MVWLSLDPQKCHIWRSLFDFSPLVCTFTIGADLILLTLLIVQNVYSRPPQGLNNLNLFHCVCLLLIWQYRNVYSIRHCSSFFSSVGRIFPSLQRHVLALWRQVRQIEPTHHGGIVFLKSYSTCYETYVYIFNLDQNEKIRKNRLSTPWTPRDATTTNKFSFCEFYIQSDCFDEINNTNK